MKELHTLAKKTEDKTIRVDFRVKGSEVFVHVVHCCRDRDRTFAQGMTSVAEARKLYAAYIENGYRKVL